MTRTMRNRFLNLLLSMVHLLKLFKLKIRLIMITFLFIYDAMNIIKALLCIVVYTMGIIAFYIIYFHFLLFRV